MPDVDGLAEHQGTTAHDGLDAEMIAFRDGFIRSAAFPERAMEQHPLHAALGARAHDGCRSRGMRGDDHILQRTGYGSDIGLALHALHFAGVRIDREGFVSGVPELPEYGVRGDVTLPRHLLLKRPAGLLAAAAAIMSVVNSCAQVDESQYVQPAAYKRQASAAPAPVLIIGGTLADSTILIPRIMGVDSGRILVFDRGDFLLKAFDLATARLGWTVGRSGGGPGEFRNPVQIVADPHGPGSWIVDAGLARATLFVGVRPAMEIPLHASAQQMARLVPLRDHMLATLFAEGNSFWGELNVTTGAITNVRPFPVPFSSQAGPSLRQSAVAVDEKGEWWGAAYVFTNSFAVYRDTAFVCAGATPYGVPPASLGGDVRNPPFWIGAVALTDSTVFIWAKDHERGDMRVIDAFSAKDCSYRRSVVLPEVPKMMGGGHGRLVLEFSEPIPRLEVLEAALVGR